MGLEVGRVAGMRGKNKRFWPRPASRSEASPQGFHRPLLPVPREGDEKDMSGAQMSPLSPKVAWG